MVWARLSRFAQAHCTRTLLSKSLDLVQETQPCQRAFVWLFFLRKARRPLQFFCSDLFHQACVSTCFPMNAQVSLLSFFEVAYFCGERPAGGSNFPAFSKIKIDVNRFWLVSYNLLSSSHPLYIHFDMYASASGYPLDFLLILDPSDGRFHNQQFITKPPFEKATHKIRFAFANRLQQS